MAVTIGEFLERLEATGILDESALGEVRSEADRYGGVDADAETFVKELHASGRLTAFQAKVLWKDRGSQLVLGNYLVEEELGRGGMGVVLRARHRVMQRRVAIKVLPAKLSKDASAIARFEREVQAAAQLMHPNIVAAHDADEFDGRHALIMEFVDGRDLSSVVKRKGPLSVEQALDCVIQAARGLEFAHGKGVVHRDIKPANLLLDSNGTVKILDMGLARFSEAADVGSVAELTGTGTIMGTVDYMSPEQAISTRNADERSDVYSLGITLWYLLVAKPAYEGDSLMSRMMAHANNPIPKLREARPDVPESVEAVFERMIAKDPAERMQTMTDVVAALEAYRGDESGTVVTAHAKGSGDSLTGDGLSDFLGSLDEEDVGDGSATGATTSGTATKRRRRKRRGTSDVESQTAISSATSGTIRSRASGSRTERVRGSKLPEWARDWRMLAAGAGGGILVILLVVASFSGGPDPVPDPTPEPEGHQTAERGDPANAAKGVEPNTGGWRPIFDGNSLDGWERFGGNDGDWRVENGVLVGTGSNTRLVYTREEFEDVAVRVRCRLAAGANSGLYIRAEKNQSWGNGYEAQLAFLGSQGTNPQFRIGSIWKYGPFSKQLLDPSETFDLEFVAVGNRLRVRVNGIETVDVTDDTFARGHIALQGHNAGKRVEFERIEIREPRALTGSSATASTDVRVEPIVELNNGNYNTAPWPSKDGLRLYWESASDAGDWEGAQTVMASRPDAGSPFGKPTLVLDGRMPTLSANERVVVFVPAGTPTLHWASRSGIDVPFGRMRQIDELASLPTPKSPFMSGDTFDLVVQQGRPGAIEFGISRKPLIAAPRPIPKTLPGMTESNHGIPITWPFLSDDGLRIWYGHGGNRETEIWTGTRSSTSEPFGDFEPVRVDGVLLVGRAPRYASATRELFFARPAPGNGWELAVVKNYAPAGDATSTSWKDLFNGRDLGTLEVVGTPGWSVENGVIVADGSGTGWLGTPEDYENFEFEFEYRLPSNGNSGICVRMDSGAISPSDQAGAIEIQLIDDARSPSAAANILTGSVHKYAARTKQPNTIPNLWHAARLRVEGHHVTVDHDGTTVLDTELPANVLATRPGRVGLQMWRTPAAFRRLRIRRLP